MKTQLKISLGCAAAVIMLGGCATSKPALQGQMDPTFGSAVKANSVAHAVAPTAAQKANTFIPADPTRAGKARQNYRENKVSEPVKNATQSN